MIRTLELIRKHSLLSLQNPWTYLKSTTHDNFTNCLSNVNHVMSKHCFIALVKYKCSNIACPTYFTKYCPYLHLQVCEFFNWTRKRPLYLRAKVSKCFQRQRFFRQKYCRRFKRLQQSKFFKTFSTVFLWSIEIEILSKLLEELHLFLCFIDSFNNSSAIMPFRE